MPGFEEFNVEVKHHSPLPNRYTWQIHRAGEELPWPGDHRNPFAAQRVTHAPMFRCPPVGASATLAPAHKPMSRPPSFLQHSR